MDPVLKSTLTSFATIAVSAALGAAVAQGYITKDQAATLTADLVGGGSILVAGALAWYAARQHTKAAQILAVNAANNGVVTVPTAAAQAAGIPVATEPLK